MSSHRNLLPAQVFPHHRPQTSTVLSHRKPRTIRRPNPPPLPLNSLKALHKSKNLHLLFPRALQSKLALRQTLTPIAENTSNNHTGTIVFLTYCSAKMRPSLATGW